MGCWDKVEAANFPIKIGATYKWGSTPELWDFEFIRSSEFKDEPRPAKFEGQRLATAFQVDRAIYDKILLDHARELGCDVFEQCKVQNVEVDNKEVSHLTLESGVQIEARYFLDASGHSGIIRRALGIEATAPTTLQNIAIWDYWQNAEWAVTIGTGGTRVQVISLGYGWIWFIPISQTRSSVGLVIPASYYKSKGLKPQELYAQAMQDDARIAGFLKGASPEGTLQTTKDWSFLAEEHCGSNWFLIGECAGFADPILAAGMSLAQMGAREAAYTILALDRGKLNGDWLKNEFQTRQYNRIKNHIRFADYWYTANAQFVDLQEFTKEIAADNGFEMTPQQSWAWLAQGGFITDAFNIGSGGYGLLQMREAHKIMTGESVATILAKTNVFQLDLAGASWQERPIYAEGSIQKNPCFYRNGKYLPIRGVIEVLIDMLQLASKLPDLLSLIEKSAMIHQENIQFMEEIVLMIPIALEAMINDGWVVASYDPSLPLVEPPMPASGIFWNRDVVKI